MWYCIQGKFCPCFIFTLFVLLSNGEFKTWRIELYSKDYNYNKTRDRANSRLSESVSYLCRAKIRMGEFKAVYRTFWVTTFWYCKRGSNFRVFRALVFFAKITPHAKIKPICLYEENRSGIVKITPTWNVLPTFSRNFPPAKITHLQYLSDNIENIGLSATFLLVIS